MMADSSIFSKQARQYAEFRPGYPPDLYDFILSRTPNHRAAWDCGTGSGQAAGVLACHFKEVYASDISEGQLQYAVQKPNITYSAQPAEKTGYPSGFFDLITVGQAFHWFDFEKFYNEARRVAGRDARIAIFGYGRAETEPHLDSVIKDLYDLAFGTYFSEPRRYVEEAYRTIPFPFQEIASPGYNIRLNWTLNELAGYFSSWSAIRKFKSDKGYSPADDAIGELKKRLRDQKTFPVTFPVFLRFGKVDPLTGR